MSYVDYETDGQYECPNCGNQNVTYWGMSNGYGGRRRVPRTLKCGECDCQFDWRTGTVTRYPEDYNIFGL